MRVLIFIVVASLSTLAIAQQVQPIPPRSKLAKTYQQNLSQLIDTTGMYASKYGNVIKLRYDNMPCIVPYKTATPIINNFNKKNLPSEIPNLYEKRPLLPKNGKLSVAYKTAHSCPK